MAPCQGVWSEKTKKTKKKLALQQPHFLVQNCSVNACLPLFIFQYLFNELEFFSTLDSLESFLLNFNFICINQCKIVIMNFRLSLIILVKIRQPRKAIAYRTNIFIKRPFHKQLIFLLFIKINAFFFFDNCTRCFCFLRILIFVSISL